MNFANLKISARLSAGFGILIVLMLTVIGISIGRFASIGDNVEFCVSGFDRWMVYNGRCRVLH